MDIYKVQDYNDLDSIVLPILAVTDYKPERQQLNYSFVFPIERRYYDVRILASWRMWTQEYINYFYLLAIAYVVVTLLGREFMKYRAPYELKTPLIIWNWILAIFSTMGAVRMFPEFYDSLVNYSFEYSVCDLQNAYTPANLWIFLFIFSKIPEVIDTFFIVLRKRPLIFLHYYHHAATIALCVFGFTRHTAAGRWLANMNYCVHSLMYTYYSLRAMRYRIPLIISKFITSLQILQMIMGVIVNSAVLFYKGVLNHECDSTYEYSILSLILYFQLFLLFSNFFNKVYIVKDREKKKLLTKDD